MAILDETYTKTEIFDAFKKTAVNSTVMCVLTFGLVSLLYNFIWYSSAYHYVKEPILLYNYVEFIRNIGWYPRCVKIIYSAGSYLCLAMAAVSYGLFYIAPRKSANLKLFWFWFCINSINYLLVQWMGNPYVNYSGVGVLVRYWYWDERDRFVAALIALIIIIFYGRFLAHHFLQFTPSMKFMKRNNYKVFALYILLFPSFVLIGVVGAFRMIHDWNVNFIMMVGIFLMSISTYLRIGERKFKADFFEETYKPRYSIVGLALLGALIALYIYLYQYGFQFEPGLF